MADVTEIWKKNLERLHDGVFGDISNGVTLLNYWMAQARAGYPGASENVKYWADILGFEICEIGERK